MISFGVVNCTFRLAPIYILFIHSTIINIDIRVCGDPSDRSIIPRTSTPPCHYLIKAQLSSIKKNSTISTSLHVHALPSISIHARKSAWRESALANVQTHASSVPPYVPICLSRYPFLLHLNFIPLWKILFLYYNYSSQLKRNPCNDLSNIYQLHSSLPNVAFHALRAHRYEPPEPGYRVPVTRSSAETITRLPPTLSQSTRAIVEPHFTRGTATDVSTSNKTPRLASCRAHRNAIKITPCHPRVTHANRQSAIVNHRAIFNAIIKKYIYI